MGVQLTVLAISRNEKDFISGFFDDIDSQSIRDKIEVIVCDGGSSDGSEKVVERRADCAVFSKPGFGRQLNNALREARGEITVRIDVDTRCPNTTTLEEVINFFKSNKLDFATLPVENLVGTDGRTQYPEVLVNLFKGWASWYGVFMTGKTEALKRIGGYDESITHGEDNAMFMKMLLWGTSLYGYRVGTLPVRVIHLRYPKNWPMIKFEEMLHGISGR